MNVATIEHQHEWRNAGMRSALWFDGMSWIFPDVKVGARRKSPPTKMCQEVICALAISSGNRSEQTPSGPTVAIIA